MFLNKAFTTSSLSQKSASIFYVTEETFIEQIVSQMNWQRMVSVVVKKGSSICGIFNERGVLTSVLSGGRYSKAAQVHEVMTQSIYLNYGCCTSA